MAQAEVVVMNGTGYDDWMQKLLAANSSQGHRAVVVADFSRLRIFGSGLRQARC